MPEFACDLHIHSTLSPCGSLDMSPRAIVEKAREAGLDIIAVTDHNMAENTPYVREAGERSGLVVLAGMELQTMEEVHVIAIFDDYDTAYALQLMVYDLLPPVANDVEFWGDQVVVDGEDNIVRSEERLLISSAGISIEEAVSWIKSHGGIAIASHVDSPTFSIISQLGFVPADIPFDALEIRDRGKAGDLMPFIMRKGLPFVTFSDAHYPGDIGKRRTHLTLDAPDCVSIEGALRALGEQSLTGQAGRS
ncbi:MAG TPA: PHP domain-containing protein [Syntrophorhabdaceae bacterium]|nr:PHP domain-containing protein [Syntrophorhabdaceae bacterium]